MAIKRKDRPVKNKPSSSAQPGRGRRSAYGSGCMNRDCKLRKGRCTGFEGCPGYRGR